MSIGLAGAGPPASSAERPGGRGRSARAELYSDQLRARGVCDTMHPLDETLAEIVAKIATIPLAAQPGARFEYSNVAVLTAGRIVELVAGQRLADYLRQNILDPLGMVDTDFFQPPEKWSRAPAVFETGTMRRLDQLDVPGTDSTQLPFSPIQRFDNIAGGLSGSAYDYFRFAQALLNGGQLDGVRIVSPNAVKLLSTNLVGDLRDNFFSHAWGYLASVQVDYNAIYNCLGLGSYGWHGYWGTVYRIWPEKDALVIFLTQGSPEPVAAWPTQRAFFSIVPAALLD
ncbi:MAG: beta-lactamase family protein [Propionibacteriaceae bacterium]|nr:beta-lactamase family protein [Propionibacteriaceae bacterium]